MTNLPIGRSTLARFHTRGCKPPPPPPRPRMGGRRRHERSRHQQQQAQQCCCVLARRAGVVSCRPCCRASSRGRSLPTADNNGGGKRLPKLQLKEPNRHQQKVTWSTSGIHYLARPNNSQPKGLLEVLVCVHLAPWLLPPSVIEATKPIFFR